MQGLATPSGGAAGLAAADEGGVVDGAGLPPAALALEAVGINVCFQLVHADAVFWEQVVHAAPQALHSVHEHGLVADGVHLDTGVPVIFGVLTTDTMREPLERASMKINLGWNYDLQEMESLMQDLG